MDFQFNEKLTKKAFEHKFMEIVGNDRDCYKNNVREMTGSFDEWDEPIYQNVTLYYIEGAHAGTWTKGKGWVFSEEAINKHIEENRRMDEILAKRDNK